MPPNRYQGSRLCLMVASSASSCEGPITIFWKQLLCRPSAPLKLSQKRTPIFLTPLRVVSRPHASQRVVSTFDPPASPQHTPWTVGEEVWLASTLYHVWRQAQAGSERGLIGAIYGAGYIGPENVTMVVFPNDPSGRSSLSYVFRSTRHQKWAHESACSSALVVVVFFVSFAGSLHGVHCFCLRVELLLFRTPKKQWYERRVGTEYFRSDPRA